MKEIIKYYFEEFTDWFFFGTGFLPIPGWMIILFSIIGIIFFIITYPISIIKKLLRN